MARNQSGPRATPDQLRIYSPAEYAHIADELEQWLEFGTPKNAPACLRQRVGRLSEDELHQRIEFRINQGESRVQELIGKLSVAADERQLDPTPLATWLDRRDEDSLQAATRFVKRMQQFALIEARRAEMKGTPIRWPN